MIHKLPRCIAAALIFLCAPLARAGAPEDALAVWRLLDYVAVDYREAVAGGAVINAGEYAEMREFAATIHARLRDLPAREGKDRLLAQAAGLAAAIEAKQEPARVAEQAAAMAQALLAAYPAPVSPTAPPDVRAAGALYAEHCATCHGASGRGDGPVAAGMEPPPINFHDRARHASRSVFALYGIIANGVEGTAMPAFPQLTDAQRWALAFHVGQMPYAAADRERGESVWRGHPAARDAVPSLAALAATTPAQLAAALGADDASALTAFLRATPSAVVPAASQSLTHAIALIHRSVEAFSAGDAGRAADLALAAYLDGFEPLEPALAAKDSALMRSVEGAMLEFRAALQRGDAAAIAGAARDAEALLERASAALESGPSAAGAFASSFVILFREGLEAVLVLVAIIAGLRRMGRLDAMPYVHAGWGAAVLLGVVTWIAANWLIDISGAEREATEGVTGLIAVAILVFVGLWLHSQALSGRWQTYLNEAIRTRLSRNRLWGLSLLAFVAVYREAFEVVLFYGALWQQGSHTAVLAGIGVAIVVLLGVSWSLFRASVKLPLRHFFLASSVFIALLAIVMAGHAASALQEAGWLGVTRWPLPAVEWLGIHPTAQTLALQGFVALLLATGLYVSRLRAAARSG